MWSSVLLLIQLISSISTSFSIEDAHNCYFTVVYSNGSRTWCLDQQCYQHLDIISLEDRMCRTNFLSLRFSSYSKYSDVLQTSSLKMPLASFFSLGRPNIERVLQIEFLSPFVSNDPFKLDHLRLLTDSISNIDTYELVFNGNIAENNLTLFIDRDMFMSHEQRVIDTLRLIFNCSKIQRVVWELIKSVENFPDSPCPQQIQFLKKEFINKQDCFKITILVGLAKSFLFIKKKKRRHFSFVDKCYYIN